MDEVTARLESLLGRYAAILDSQDYGGRAWEQLREELQLLIAEYGPGAVDAALNILLCTTRVRRFRDPIYQLQNPRR